MFHKKAHIFIVLILLFPSMIYAHRVTIFAWIEGDRVFTQSKFSGGKRVKNGLVMVFDKQGQKLLKGRTNNSGEFSFVIPKKTEMKIVVEAGMGHSAHWILPEDSFEEDLTDTQPGTTEKNVFPAIQIENTRDINLSAIEKMIEKTLDRKMKPIIRQLNQVLAPKNEPSFSDILAGIGYILGLVGIGTYVHYKNKMNAMRDKT